MIPTLARLGALTLALFSSHAGAVGFGEIVLHSRVGEPLRAAVPILSGTGETIDNACFSLAALRGSELPVVSNARTRLLRNAEGYQLLITGITPIHEPAFIIGLRANCGVELQRDYVLMPAAPLTLANEAPPPMPGRTPPKLANRDGETGSAARQGRRQVDQAPPPEAKKPRRKRLPSAPLRTSDRLVLGPPPEELKPGEKATPRQSSPNELEERMLKLETSLHLLNLETDKLNQALALKTEALALQTRIQADRTPLPDALLSVKTTSAATPTPNRSSRDNWLEFLLSALAGIVIAVGIAYLLGRRPAGTDREPLLAPPGMPELPHSTRP